MVSVTETDRQAFAQAVHTISSERGAFAGPATAKPLLMVVVAPPRTGKSTLVEAMARQHFFPPETQFIASEAFHQLDLKVDPRRTIHHAFEVNHQSDYGKVLSEQVGRALDARQSLVVETLGRDVKALGQLTDKARQKGYEVIGVAVFTEPQKLYDVKLGDTAKAHAQGRREQRLGMMKDIAQRWETQLTPLFDYSMLFHAVKESGQKRLTAVAEYQAKDKTILNEGLYDRFQQWQQANPRAASADHVLPAGAAQATAGERRGVGPGGAGSGTAPSAIVLSPGSVAARFQQSASQGITGS